MYKKQGRTAELLIITQLINALESVFMTIIPFHFLTQGKIHASRDVKERRTFVIRNGDVKEVEEYLTSLECDGGSVLDVSVITSTSLALIFTDGLFTFPPGEDHVISWSFFPKIRRIESDVIKHKAE